MPDDNPIENSIPAIWKISHGDFKETNKKDVEERNDLRTKNLVVACYNEKSKQGGRQSFKNDINEGDFFFLCYGSKIQLLGRFIGEAQSYSKRKTRRSSKQDSEKQQWFGWEYTVIENAKKSSYKRDKGQDGGKKRDWEPDRPTTCSRVGEGDERNFEDWILQPYFGMSLADLRSKFGERGYWWLNADDGIKDFSEIPLGGTEDIKLLNNDGNERLKQSNFLNAKAGDVVAVYQSQKVIALCEISKSVNKDDPKDKQNIQIRKWKALGSPISIDELKELENLGSEEPFQKAPSDQGPFAVKRGTLFKLTKDGFDPIMDLIRGKNLPHTSPDVPSPTPDATKNYWWVVASLRDKNWKDRALSDYDIGEVQTYTLLKENGEPLRIKQNFSDAKVGDIVIGYQTKPDSGIVALCEICAEVNKDDDEKKKNIQIKKIAHLDSPIAYSAFKDLPELSKQEGLRGRFEGSLFKLTKEEFDVFMGLIWKENKGSEGIKETFLKVYQQLPKEDDEEKMPRLGEEEKKKRVSNSDAGEEDGYNRDDFLDDVYLGKTRDEGKEKYAMLESLLETKKNIILQGPPGVGKTFAAKRLAWSILKKKSDNHPQIQFVQFHQSYSYEDFVEGYKPKKDGDGFELRHGVFYKFCKEAQKREEAYKENPKDTSNWYFLIIDEINRGNTSRIFGELLMLIENGYRGKKHALKLAYEEEDEQDSSEKEDKRFYVPENLFIIGMMNTADRSLAMLDYALRRRFAFVDMRPAFDSDGFKDYCSEKLGEDIRSENKGVFGKLIDAVKALNEKIADDKSLGQGFCIGHSYFCNWKECTERKMRNAVWYDILPLLREYYFDNQTKYVECLKPLSSTNLLPQEEQDKLKPPGENKNNKSGTGTTGDNTNDDKNGGSDDNGESKPKSDKPEADSDGGKGDET